MKVQNIVKSLTALFIALVIVACSSNDGSTDVAGASGESNEGSDGKNLDFEGDWATGCIPDGDGAIRVNFHVSGESNDRYGYIENKFLTTTCSNLPEVSRYAGSISYGKVLTTSEGLTAQEIDFKNSYGGDLDSFDGDGILGLVGLDGDNNLYLNLGFDGSRPSGLEEARQFVNAR